MRLIEQQMNEAITTKADQWAKDNTSVMFIPQLDQSFVYLHGNFIAFYDHIAGTVSPVLSALAAWPTNTTKSRLRALGVNVATRKGVTYIDNVAV